MPIKIGLVFVAYEGKLIHKESAFCKYKLEIGVKFKLLLT
jgi:hypothetical protein